MKEHLLRVRIDGMHCASCINRLDAVLSREGALDVDIDILKGMGVIRFEKEFVSAEELLQVIEDAGYEATLLSVASVGP